MTNSVAPHLFSDWITPEKQLEILYSNFAEKIKAVAPIITELAIVIAQYGLDGAATDWYIVLACVKKICPKAFPKTIPPLPQDILEILDSRCPIYANQTKPDGTPHLLKDTHVLVLYPKEFGTVNQFLSGIVDIYSQVINEELVPLSFRNRCNGSFHEYAEAPPEDTHWGLKTKSLLPESFGKTWQQQVVLVARLCKQTLAIYKIPNLRQCLVTYVSCKIATGKNFYVPRTKCDNNGVFTRVKETAVCANLGFGVRNKQPGAFARPSIGILAIRTFEENSAKKNGGCCVVS